MSRRSSPLARRAVERAAHHRLRHHWLLFNRAVARFSRFAYTTGAGRRVAASLEVRRTWARVRIRLGRGGAALAGMRVVFLSDLHAGHYLGERELAALVDRVHAQRPHLICLGGDLVNYFEDEIDLLAKSIAHMHAPLGVYAVPGNHDYYADPGLGRWCAALEGAGIEVLRNRGLRLRRGDASLWLAGVDDLRKGQPELGRALVGHDESEPVLLLSHHPDLFMDASAAGVDLTLAGHTHGGQITLRGWTPLRHTHYGFWSGLHEHAGSQLFVGRGAGVSFMPVRFDAPAELVCVELEAPDAARGLDVASDSTQRAPQPDAAGLRP